MNKPNYTKTFLARFPQLRGDERLDTHIYAYTMIVCGLNGRSVVLSRDALRLVKENRLRMGRTDLVLRETGRGFIEQSQAGGVSREFAVLEDHEQALHLVLTRNPDGQSMDPYKIIPYGLN